MAYIKNTAFEVKVSNHEFDSIANITGKFRTDGEADVCSAGFLCVRDELMPNEGYEAFGIMNTNSWFMAMAEAPTSAVEPIYACNPFDVNMISDGATGAVYKVGSNTLGLAAPADYPTTYTQILFNNVNVYRFGVGNLSAELGENTFFTIANGQLVPAAAAPSAAGAPYFQLVRAGSFTQGAYNGFGFVDVRACVAVGTSAPAGE